MLRAKECCYDRLQRPVRTASLGFDGQWIYQDSRYNIRGQLIEQSTPYYAGQSPAGWSIQHYDLLGRLTETTQPDGTLGQRTTYQGLTQTLTNALGQTRTETRNRLGELAEVKDAEHGTIHITEASRGNGLTSSFAYDPYFRLLTHQYAGLLNASLSVQDIGYAWDALGNLTYRHNQSALADHSGQKDLKESFCYDGLNRLIKAHRGSLSGPCTLAPAEQDVEYDGLGNITRKADVGTYSYGTASHTQAGPHAVTQAGGVLYTYDANGNQTGGDGRSLTYNSVDKPTRIEKGDHTTRFEYGPDRSRYLRLDQSRNPASGATLGPITRTRYIGNLERIQTEGQNTITWRRHLGAAVYSIKTDRNFQPLTGAQANTRHYVYQDHLGSTDVITNEGGEVIQSLSFDAWGQRRNEQDWEAIISQSQLKTFDTEITNRGFTGHEQLDAVGLIHMNGRVYDPKLGRFLQADPFIQEADNTQSYNRYSYVINNPLNATDPSGFGFLGFLSKAFSTIGNILKNIPGCELCQSIGRGLQIAGTILQNAAFVNSALTANNAVGALQGAFTAANFLPDFGLEGLGNSLAGSPVDILFVGTGSDVLFQVEGNFGHGFASAATPGMPSPGAGEMAPVRALQVADTVTGGTESAITGGKFANGAVTSAMAFAFNQVATSQPKPQPISRGNNAVLTDDEIANIVFNETASLSGPGIDDARAAIANAIINGDERFGQNRPATAPSTINRALSTSEQNDLQGIKSLVAIVRAARLNGVDTVGGNNFFGLRDGTDPIFGSVSAALTQDKIFSNGTVQPVFKGFGPFNNSFPSPSQRLFSRTEAVIVIMEGTGRFVK